MSDVPPVGTVLGRLHTVETYLSYDGPKLFAARSGAGQTYLGLYVADDEQGEIYLYVPVSPDRWRDLRRGAISLRTAIASPEDDYVYRVLRPVTQGDAQVDRVDADDIPADWLPDADAILRLADTPLDGFTRESLGAEALAKVRPGAAIELFTDFPADDFPLRALGNLMQLVQENVEAFAQEVLGRATAAGPVQQAILEDTELSFAHLRAASVVLVVFPRAGGRLFASPVVGQALARLHSVMSASADPEELRTTLSNLGPRAIAKYRDLLEEVADTSHGVTLHVADEYGGVVSAALDGDEIREALVAARTSQAEPAATLEITALLIGVNVRTHVFELFDEIESRKYSGKVVDEARAQIRGLTIGERYSATILEEHEYAPLTGEITYKYRLLRIEPS